MQAEVVPAAWQPDQEAALPGGSKSGESVMPNGDYPPLMHWNLTDFLQCLEVEPRSVPHVWTFEVHRDGLKLLVTIHDYPGNVHISLLRESGTMPLIDLQMAGCRGVLYAVRDGVECLEFAPSRLYPFSSRFDSQYLIEYGVRLSVRPDISIRFFEASSTRTWPLIGHLK